MNSIMQSEKVISNNYSHESENIVLSRNTGLWGNLPNTLRNFPHEKSIIVWDKHQSSPPPGASKTWSPELRFQYIPIFDCHSPTIILTQQLLMNDLNEITGMYSITIASNSPMTVITNWLNSKISRTKEFSGTSSMNAT